MSALHLTITVIDAVMVHLCRFTIDVLIIMQHVNPLIALDADTDYLPSLGHLLLLHINLLLI